MNKEIKKIVVSLLVITLIVPTISGMFLSKANGLSTELTLENNRSYVYESDMPGITGTTLSFSDIQAELPADYGEYIVVEDMDPMLNTLWCDGATKRAYFNVELYLDMNVKVYGDPYINAFYIANDYDYHVKNFATDENDTTLPMTYFRQWYDVADLSNKPYQNSPLSASEIATLREQVNTEDAPYQIYEITYRYLGFTLMQSQYANPEFPEDSKDNWDNNQWIKEAWIYRSTRGAAEPYTVMAMNLEGLSTEQANAAKQNLEGADIGPTIDSGDKVNWDHSAVTDYVLKGSPYYINAQGTPTQYTSERKIMWHYEESGNRFYQTLSLDRINESTDKAPVYGNVSVNILDKENEKLKMANQNETSDTLTLNEVLISLTLDDAWCYETDDMSQAGVYTEAEWIEAKKATMWNREDLDYWVVSVTVGGPVDKVTYTSDQIVSVTAPRGNNENISVSGAITSFTIYDLEVPVDTFSDEGLLLVEVEAYAVMKSPADDAPFQTEPDTDFDSIGDIGLRSMFKVNPSIVSPIEVIEVPSSSVNYRDLSMGDINTYRLQISSTETARTDIGSYTIPLSEANINSFLASFMKNDLAVIKSQLISEADEGEDISTIMAGKSYTYQVDQTVTDFSGKTDTYSRLITVSFDFFIPKVVVPELIIPDEIWDIEDLNVIDLTDKQYLDHIDVTVNGVSYNADNFFKGINFGLLDKDTFYEIEISYTSTDNITLTWIHDLKVKTTLPRVAMTVGGTLKANRKVTITDISDVANSAELMATYPITARSWSLEAIDGTPLLEGSGSTDTVKELLSKSPGEYRVKQTVLNAAGRSNTNYVEFRILPDYKANIILNIWNSTATRNEQIDSVIEIASLDGDIVTSSKIEIFEDIDKDGIIDAEDPLYQSFTYAEWVSTDLVMNKLANFIVRVTAIEEFGEPTIPEFITEADYITTVMESELNIVNIRPMTAIYLDEETVYPKADVTILLDPVLTQEETDFITSNRINYMNELIKSSIDANVKVWDLHTYSYSQNISLSDNTRTSYPASTYNYNIDGWTGTLDRTSVTNNKYQVAVTKYHWVTRTDTATKSITGGNAGYSKAVYLDGVKQTAMSSSTNTPSVSYSSNGWTGTLPKKSATIDRQTSRTSNGYYIVEKWWNATYSGTVYKDFYESYTDYEWRNNYTGYYSGEVGKSIKQNFAPDFYRADSKKYIIYLTTDNTMQLASDMSYLENLGTAKTMVAGLTGVEGSYAADEYILDQSIELAMIDALDVIKSENEYEPSTLTVLVGEDVGEFTFSTLDADGDAIGEREYQIVHDITYYDNPEAQDEGTVLAFDENSYVSALTTDFSNVGLYDVFTRVTDDTGTPEYNLTSNEPNFRIKRHRKPIAQPTLDWTYNINTNLYDIIFAETDYDPDYEFSDADQGIVDVVVVYWDDADPATKYYKIPDSIEPNHNYTMEYMVQDIDGAWSDIVTLNFAAGVVPPIQLDARLKAVDEQYSLLSFPATEDLSIYNIWTRFPYGVDLEYALYDVTNTAVVIPSRDVVFSEGVTGTKVNQDIDWNDITLNIPGTVYDGSYTVRLTANGSDGQTKEISWPIIVSTPADLTATVSVEDERMTLSSVPSTEKIIVEDIVVDYKRTVNSIDIQLVNADDDSIIDTVTVVNTPGVTANRNGDLVEFIDSHEFTLDSTTIDGDYLVRISADTYDRTVTTEYPYTVYSPVWESYESDSLQEIEAWLDATGVMILDDVNTISLTTSDYTSKIDIVMGDIQFTVYDDERLSFNNDGTGKGLSITNQFGTIENLSIVKGANEYIWTMDISPSSVTIPEGTITGFFTSYDLADEAFTSNNKHDTNPQSYDFEFASLKLEELRLTKILDPTWKNSITSDILTDSFAVLKNQQNKIPKIGYKANFEIDASGMTDPADHIDIDVRFFALDNLNVLHEVDAFVYEQGSYKRLQASNMADSMKSIVLADESKYPYEPNPGATNKATFRFSYYLPFNTKFVPVGNNYNPFTPYDYRYLLVTFDINATKVSSGAEYDYTLNESEWGTTPIPYYGHRINTDADLLGKGINHGEILWFKLTETAEDDFFNQQEW